MGVPKNPSPLCDSVGGGSVQKLLRFEDLDFLQKSEVNLCFRSFPANLLDAPCEIVDDLLSYLVPDTLLAQ